MSGFFYRLNEALAKHIQVALFLVITIKMRPNVLIIWN